LHFALGVVLLEVAEGGGKSMNTEAGPAKARTGVPGLDDILLGGLATGRIFLLEGSPGTGKTTMALRFLMEGAAARERGLYITLSETAPELHATAASHGWNLDGIDVLEILASETSLTPDARLTMYHPSEVELSETTKSVLAEAARLKPARLVLDSLSEFRLLAETSLRYRRQIFALKHFFTNQKTTVLFVDDRTSEKSDIALHSLAHGVISLERETPEYGTVRRRLNVSKMRGRAFREGLHDFVIRTGGVEIFPRLVAAEHWAPYVRGTIPSNLAPLDALLGGGLTKGSSTLIIGPAGTGKSSLATRIRASSSSTNR
jgi:circadian clock protein KaiC